MPQDAESTVTAETADSGSASTITAGSSAGIASSAESRDKTGAMMITPATDCWTRRATDSLSECLSIERTLVIDTE